MSTATVNSATVRGTEAAPVTVEIGIERGLPAFHIIGMAGTDVQESRLRVRAALRASGFAVPDGSVTVNLSPGTIRKSGTGYDLPIAAGILVATGQVDPAIAEGCVFCGELGLDGSVRADGVDVYNSARLAHTTGMELVTGTRPSEPILPCNYLEVPSLLDLADGKLARRRIARSSRNAEASGTERVLPDGNVLLVGSRIDAAALACAHADSLPALAPDAEAEVASVYSAARADCRRIADGKRPFRAPHSSITVAGMVGGGMPVRPGEASLAHGGVLFLEDVQGFSPAVLQALRQPISEGAVRIARADGVYEMPAAFQLVCSAPPCPCGNFGDSARDCTCSAGQVRAWQQRIEGIADKLGCRVVHV